MTGRNSWSGRSASAVFVTAGLITVALLCWELFWQGELHEARVEEENLAQAEPPVRNLSSDHGVRADDGASPVQVEAPASNGAADRSPLPMKTPDSLEEIPLAKRARGALKKVGHTRLFKTIKASIRSTGSVSPPR